MCTSFFFLNPPQMLKDALPVSSGSPLIDSTLCVKNKKPAAQQDPHLPE
jgi:hypothetical protein